MDRKQRLGELAAELQKSTNVEVLMVKDLVEGLIEDTAFQMVECDPNDLNRLQGEARAFRRLHMMLTRPPASVRPGV